MAMDRRDTFKLAGVAAAAVAIPTMAVASEKKQRRRQMVNQ